ncbi:MAG: 3'(2'),5'-bisphosphate nucleotidase CysQ [Thermodesulfobacteriota bacterium]
MAEGTVKGGEGGGEGGGGGLSDGLVGELSALADAAGRAILEIYSGADFGTTYKDDRSPLTMADEASNRVIIAGLADIAPGIPVLSEESGQVPYGRRRDWERFFLVDPLDGTKEFIKRNGEFTVNIALVEGGRPVVGVVHCPALGVTYSGVAGSGAKKASKGGSIAIRAGGPAGGALKVVASRSHRGEATDRFVERLRAEGRQVEFVGMGSSLKLCLVAEGAAHLYPRFGPTMEWDTAAAQCVVEAAGGAVTDLDGAPLVYNKEDLLNPYFMVVGDPAFTWQRYIY